MASGAALTHGGVDPIKKIPLLTIKAGPRDRELWIARLKEEFRTLIQYVYMNKEADNDWFKISSDHNGLEWGGYCWYVDEQKNKYEFQICFEIPVAYPDVPIEIQLPELEGKTPKMYRGGKICLEDLFLPLWRANLPQFGIAHALAFGLAPWLATEVPLLIEAGLITPKALENDIAA